MFPRLAQDWPEKSENTILSGNGRFKNLMHVVRLCKCMQMHGNSVHANSAHVIYFH